MLSLLALDWLKYAESVDCKIGVEDEIYLQRLVAYVLDFLYLIHLCICKGLDLYVELGRCIIR